MSTILAPAPALAALGMGTEIKPSFLLKQRIETHYPANNITSELRADC